MKNEIFLSDIYRASPQSIWTRVISNVEHDDFMGQGFVSLISVAGTH